MDRIERPMWEPHHCCFTLKHEDPEGFYAGCFIEGHDPRAVIAVSHVRTLARDLGYVHPDDHQSALDQIVQLSDQVDAMQAELDHMQRQVEAIDLLQSAGYVARKKPGRPVKQPEEAAA